jgi:hypothetical protein
MIGALWRFRGLLAEMFDRRSAVHALKPCRLLIPKNTDIRNGPRPTHKIAYHRVNSVLSIFEGDEPRHK